MTCPACGEEERQERKTVLEHAGPLTVHHACLDGQAWHLPLVLKLGAEPAPRDCEGSA